MSFGEGVHIDPDVEHKINELIANFKLHKRNTSSNRANLLKELVKLGPKGMVWSVVPHREHKDEIIVTARYPE